MTIAVTRDSSPSAADELREARRFVDNAESVEYQGQTDLTVTDAAEFEAQGIEFPEAQIAASEFTTSAHLPGRSRSIVQSAGIVVETIDVDGITYTRVAEREEALAEEQWIRFDPATVSFDDPVEFLVHAPSRPLGSPPISALEIPALVHAARRPQIIEQSGGRTILRVNVDADKLSGFLSTTLRVDLVIADGGRPTAVRLVGNDEAIREAVLIHFDRWNGAVDIVAPSEAELDATPGLDEEDIAAYADAPLLQPRAIPEQWILATASVIPVGGFGVENEPRCAQVQLSFVAPSAFDPKALPNGSTYLDLFSSPSSCAEERPEHARPFSAGGVDGWLEGDDGYTTGQLVVGRTSVYFETDLSRDELAAILGELAPLDLSNPPASVLQLS